jgi:Bacterial SH3 domain
MDSATEKLELGLQRLAKAGHDTDMLGLALQSIHGALEDHFRARLSTDSHMPVEQRAAMADPKQTQWRDLLDAMQLYGDLSAPNRELIWRTNALRTKVAHGGRYTGSRADLERYAALARSLCSYPADAKPALVPQPRAPAEKSAVKLARAHSSASPDIPRALRTGAAAAPARRRSPWPGGLLALALLLGLATFAVLRRAPAPRAESAAPTALATVALVIAAPVATPTTELLQTPLPRAATVTAQAGLNLRAEPNDQAALVGMLSTGTRVTISGEPVQAGGYTWWNVEVELDGQRGWCAGEFLSFDR